MIKSITAIKVKLNPKKYAQLLLFSCYDCKFISLINFFRELESILRIHYAFLRETFLRYANDWFLAQDKFMMLQRNYSYANCKQGVHYSFFRFLSFYFFFFALCFELPNPMCCNALFASYALLQNVCGKMSSHRNRHYDKMQWALDKIRIHISS